MGKVASNRGLLRTTYGSLIGTKSLINHFTWQGIKKSQVHSLFAWHDTNALFQMIRFFCDGEKQQSDMCALRKMYCGACMRSARDDLGLTYKKRGLG